MLTGTGIRIGSVEDFSANIRYARGLATDGTTVWLFDASRGYTLNTTTGAAFAVAPSVTGFDNSETTVRSATYHDSQVLVFGSSQGRIQVFDTTAGTLTNWHSNAISYAGSEGGVPALWGFTSLNGTLYALDRQVSALYTVSRVGVLTRVGDATAFGINSANPRGLTAYRNMLIGSDQGLGKIFVIDPVTGVGTIIGETNTLPDDNAEALVEFDGQLLMAGSQNDALFRLYDVLWDETIAALEIDEGTSGTLLDLSTVSQDAVSFSLQGTPPSWLSINGNNLDATNAPDVTADTDYDVEVRATRDSVNADKTLGVAVRSTGVAVLSFGSETIADQTWETDTAVDLTLPASTGGAGGTEYTLSPALPAGLTFDETARTITGTPTAALTSTEYTYTATDDDGTAISLTFDVSVSQPQVVITVTPPVFESHKVSVRLDIEGQDLTTYLPSRVPLSIGKTRDFPNLGVFKSGRVNIPLQNASGMFDPGNASNFFVSQGLPSNGRGAKVLVQVVRDGAEVFNFAGEVVQLNQTLGSSIVTLSVRDLSVRLRRTSVENFGGEIIRRITDYEGANADYDELNPVFYFPVWALPISQGSVSLTVEEDGSDVTINVVEVVATTGVLSNRNAEIDYSRGLIRFEAAPEDAENTVIDATWKQDYRYRRPDALIRELLENADIDTQLGLNSEDTAFAIEQALVRDGANRVFSSNGRPYFQREGIVRWMVMDESDLEAIKRYFALDAGLVEYDERQDKYELLSSVPSDTTVTNNPPGGYGTEIEDEQVELSTSVNSIADITIFRNEFLRGGFVSPDRFIYRFSLSGDYLGVFAEFDMAGSIISLAVLGDNVYVLWDRAQGVDNTSRIIVLNDNGEEISNVIINQSTERPDWIAVTPNRIFLHFGNNIRLYDHDYNYLSGESFSVEAYAGGTRQRSGFAVNSDYVFLLSRSVPQSIIQNSMMHVYLHDGTEVTALDFTNEEVLNGGLHVERGRAYSVLDFTGNPDTVYVYNVAQTLNYHSFVPVQFDTTDFENFYVLTTNTLRADIISDASFNQNVIRKYVKSTDTWTTLLDSGTGQPQISHPNDFINRIEYLVDNRKNFQVVRRNNKTLIFYRRAAATTASIAYYDDTNDVITNVREETYTSADDEGVPYSMDFALDERSDGIYVYSFVVRYTSSSATLKVFRERVEPSGSETEIFSETFTISNNDYPISVSDVILADNRSKWYFVLSYFNDDDDTISKAELCTIAKDGTGSRTVLKTYINPLLSARSPAKIGNRYFYLEGGSVRLPKSDLDDNDLPDDERYYPDVGGNLIEIESNNDITDHGLIWRSGTVLDSPDPVDTDNIYDGWGRHNAIVSNTVGDDRGNLHVVAGYGLPYRFVNNLPVISQSGSVPDASNFVWVQWGQDLATKIPSFPTAGSQSWDLIARLAQSLNWEIGFGPRKRKADALQASDASITDWQANALFFLRPRTIIPAELRTGISVSSTASTIRLNYSGLPAERLEFPAPPSGESFKVLIDKEIFSYTGASEDTQGVELSGVTREVDGSEAAAHSAEADVFFVDGVIRDTDSSLVSVQGKNTDLSNLYNVIAIRHRDGVHRVEDSDSIEENGERALTLNMAFLSKETFNWFSLLAAEYLERFKDFREVVTLSVPYSPLLELGQLLVLKIDRGFTADYEKYEVMRVTDNLRGYQTTLILREY